MKPHNNIHHVAEISIAYSHKITKQLVAAGKIIGIPILDHLIITSVNYYSMADNDDI